MATAEYQKGTNYIYAKMHSTMLFLFSLPLRMMEEPRFFKWLKLRSFGFIRINIFQLQTQIGYILRQIKIRIAKFQIQAQILKPKLVT